MSDIRKALDAYKKASGNNADKSGSEDNDRGSVERIDGRSVEKGGKKIEKYVFSSFVDKEKKGPQASSGSFFIKETVKKGPDGGPEQKEKPYGKTPQGQPESLKREENEKTAAGKSEKGYEKIAKVLLLLGKDEASSVLKHFRADEIDKIASALIRVKSIDKGEASRLLGEINRKAKLGDTFSGGVETARKMLHKAFGEEAGEKFLVKALPEAREKPFEFLQDIEPLQIKLAMKGEPVMMLALVMNYLSPEKSAALLKEYPLDEQKEIMLRMASGGKIRREVFEKMEQVIKEKVRTQGKVITQRIDGRSKLASILKFMDIRDEEEIIRDLSEFDPGLSEEIRDQVYTIDIVLNIPDLYLQKVLNDFSEREIAVILKGREDKIKDRILSCLSQTRKELVRQESDYLGIMRKSEVNISTREFIDYLKQAEKDGAIVINRAGDLIF